MSIRVFQSYLLLLTPQKKFSPSYWSPDYYSNQQLDFFF